MSDGQGRSPQAPANPPAWDLSDLYQGRDDPRLTETLAAAAADASAFHERYAGKVASLDASALGEAIANLERQEERQSHLLSYAYLQFAENVGAPETGRFLQDMQEKVSAISAKLIFFTLEINAITDKAMTTLLADPSVARYAPWLRQVRAFRPHQLSDELERFIHDKSVAGRGAWVRLFDETIAALRFPLDGKLVTEAEALSQLSDPDPARRQAAGETIGKIFGDNIRLFAHITNSLAKDKEIEDRWRHFPRPVSARNLGNQVEDETVDALIDAVRQAYPRLSHRYYQMKARWLGQEKLAYWDRNAPLPDQAERPIPWAEAQSIVLDAYGRFSPELATIGRRFFDEGWIDAAVRDGKASGAFSHPTVPSAHPYILMNYQGKARDVQTLAHELGHGVHQVLAAGQGHFLADTPLTLAETASVFGEMLTFRALLDQASPADRTALLAGKVEDMLNTVVRQIAFFQFEQKVHEARRRDGELAAETIGDIWLDVQRESLGPAFHFADEYRHFWAYIPHFIHSPFYVYAYAFGDCLVNSLYATYAAAPDGFQDKYLTMLRAGGTLRHQDLLAPFGLDAADPGFWHKGLGMIEGFIDELAAANPPA